jgi:hypothetical protein
MTEFPLGLAWGLPAMPILTDNMWDVRALETTSDLIFPDVRRPAWPRCVRARRPPRRHSARLPNAAAFQRFGRRSHAPSPGLEAELPEHMMFPCHTPPSHHSGAGLPPCVRRRRRRHTGVMTEGIPRNLSTPSVAWLGAVLGFRRIGKSNCRWAASAHTLGVDIAVPNIWHRRPCWAYLVDIGRFRRCEPPSEPL